MLKRDNKSKNNLFRFRVPDLCIVKYFASIVNRPLDPFSTWTSTELTTAKAKGTGKVSLKLSAWRAKIVMQGTSLAP